MDNLIAINALVALGAALLGYLFGSIPNGVIVGRLLFHKDPREFGSKNSGGTNVARTMGRRYGVLVIFLDMLKALAPIFVTWAILTFTPLEQYMHWGAQVGYTTIGGAKTWYWLAGLFAAIGHCWPLYIRFKGGKAVASFMGINCGTSWIQFVTSGISYFLLAAKTKFISLTSIVVSICGTVVAWLIFLLQCTVNFDFDILLWSFGAKPFITYGMEYAIVVTIMATILILRHSSNIKRLREGTETINPFSKEAKGNN